MSHILKFTAKTITAALCVAVFVSSGVIIYADNDDEYIQFNDYETAQAYRFWSLYGLNPDTSSTYTQTYVTNGNITQSAQISLVGTNHEGGTMSTTITEVMNKVVDAGENIYDYDIAEVFNEIELKVAADPNDNRDAISIHPGGCQITGYTTNNGTQYQLTSTCDDSIDYYYNNSTYEIEAGKTDSSAWIHVFPQTTSYNDSLTGAHHSAVYEGFETEGNHISSISLTETINESGTISSSGTITTTTTTTNTNSLKYVYPVIKGTITNSDSNSSTRQLRNIIDNPYTLVFMASNNTAIQNYIHCFINDSGWYEEDGFVHRQSNIYLGGYLLYIIEFYNSNYERNRLFQIKFDQNNIFSNGLIPLFANYKNRMSNDLYRYVYGSDRLIEAINSQGSQTRDLIDNGTPDSQAANTELLGQSGEFGEASDSLFTFEEGQIDVMDDRLDNATTPFDKDLLRSSKFIASANWVTDQFMRLVGNTPLELVLYFCLTMGLAIVFIKKVE